MPHPDDARAGERPRHAVPGGRPLAPVPVEGGTRHAAVARAVALIRRQLAGERLVLAPRDPRSPGPRPSALGDVPAAPAAAVVLPTSGTTGRRRLVALTLDALVAHAGAAHDRLGGPGRWLLLLPIHHVAGWQVLLRAALSGPEPPTVLDTSGGFRPGALPAVVGTMPGGRPRYTSLVPTQLSRALADASAVHALAGLDAVLVGGAATPAPLLERARAAGLRVVETYGLTETGGGCVYDGIPLDGVEVAERDGLLEIAGPTLAAGYVGGDAEPDGAFVVRDGRRWVRTADLGTVDAAGHVAVHGRADDVVVTGGVKVSPQAVEAVLLTDGAVAEAVVVGLPDEEWGSAVTAVVVMAPHAPPPNLADVRERVAAALGRAHAPRALVVVPHLPLRGPGKVDRSGVARLAADILAEPGTSTDHPSD